MCRLWVFVVAFLCAGGGGCGGSVYNCGSGGCWGVVVVVGGCGGDTDDMNESHVSDAVLDTTFCFHGAASGNLTGFVMASSAKRGR